METVCVVILYRQNISAHYHSREVHGMKKRVLTLMMALIMILAQVSLFPAASQAASGAGSVKIQLSVDKESVRKGQIFYLTYNISNASEYDISYLSFSIMYNSKDFEYCEFIYSTSNHCHKGNKEYVNESTSKINVVFESNPDSAYFHGQSRTASIALKMKYKGSGYSTDTAREFTISNAVVKSEANYTYTGKDHTFSASEVQLEKASVNLVALSSDNTLSDIVLKTGGSRIALEPAFSPEVTQYSAYAEFSQSGISANFPVNHSGATVSHNFSQKINTGSNNYHIVVTAENGSIRTYNINLHLVPQGMTVAEYKEFLAQQNAPVSSVPTESEPVQTITETDTEPEDEIEDEPEDAPIIIEDTVTPTDTDESETESKVSKNSGGVKGFLENLSPAVLIGILGGLIVLVASGFTAGYIAHKKIQREKMIANYMDYYSDDYYDDGYPDYSYAGEEYYEGEEYYDEY